MATGNVRIVNGHVARVKDLPRLCIFGGVLACTLRDRLLCGLDCKKIQNKLLGARNLIFDLICKITASMRWQPKVLKSASSHLPKM